jgi:serine kinase
MAKLSGDARVLNERGYHLLNDLKLGEGTYAKVKCAYSNNIKQNVAVKIIDRRRAPKDFINKFLPREMVIIQTLHHKHIIEVFQVFEVYFFFI